ncbi:MAG: hypothetical protein GXO35_06360, partial [Gammaproteobacteria bacterium]|nr:hypothetical protein [Gammaproteobacteria bacterium]
DDSNETVVTQSASVEKDSLEDALSGFEDASSATSNASSGSHSDLEDALEGFGDTPILATQVESNAPKVVKKVSPLTISGQLSAKSAFAYQSNAPQIGGADYRGLTKLQLTGLVKFDYKIAPDWKSRLEIKGGVDSIYTLKGRSHYSSDSLNTYESDLEIGEAYVSGSLTDDLDIKIGRQIVVWGKSDSIRLTDVMNPLDNRELGLVDIEDLRLPVLMTKLDYYQGDWQLSLLAQHEHRNPKEAAVNSEYFPTGVLPTPPGFVFPDIEADTLQLDETTFSVAATGRFSGWDLSLYAGRFQDSRWHFTEGNTQRAYGQFNMAGLATNVMVDSWLLKAELAILDDLQYNTVTAKQTRIDGLLGLEYKGFTDTTISFEVADRYLPDHVVAMESLPDAVKQHNLQTALRVLYNFNHDRATLGYLGQYFGETFEQGGFHRVWLDYELTQSVNVTGGVIDYFGGDNALLEAMKNNDKLFVEAKYYF